MTYTEYKNIRKKEFNELPFFFAFSKKKFDEILKEKGYNSQDVTRFGTVTFSHKKDFDKIKECFEKHETTLNALLKDKSFFKEAMIYEMKNHEYSITHDLEDALGALDISYDFVKENGFEDVIYDIVRNYDSLKDMPF